MMMAKMMVMAASPLGRPLYGSERAQRTIVPLYLSS